MERAPQSPELNEQQILARLAQIDKEHFELTESLNLAPTKFQESTQGDDDAIEEEGELQELATIRRKLEALQLESKELHDHLDRLRKAA